ncbi:MAG TPA: MlaD family protein [Alphaproteobacteria bacterium]|jgi:phospholipid/cholesterol/gamma-HCH transport system substrate-binding protein
MRKLSRQDFETATGAVAMLGAALALWLASAGGRAAAAGDSYLLTARFDQVDGLAVGNPVFLAGIQVGSVRKIELAPGTLKPLITMTIRRGLAIPTDSAALVMSDGVLGGKFVRIEAGSETEALKPGERFQTVQDSIIVEQILQKIVQGAEARRRGDEKKDEPPKPEAPEKKPDAPGKTPDEQKQ